VKKMLSILVILAHVNCFAQDSLYVKIEGSSQPPVNGENIDREEAILDARMKVDRKLNFNIIMMIERENYTKTDLGYDSDSTYNIILEGNVPLIGGNSVYVRIVGENIPPKSSVKVDSTQAHINAKMKAMAIDTLDIEDMFDSEYYIITNVGYVNDSTYQCILEGWALKEEKTDWSGYAIGGSIAVGVLAVIAAGVFVYMIAQTLKSR